MARKSKSKKPDNAQPSDANEPERLAAIQSVDSLLATVTQFLDELEIEYSQPRMAECLDTKYFGLDSEVTLDNGTYKLKIHNEGRRGQCLVFYASSPLLIPQKRRMAVAEFVARGNWDAVIGNLEMDFRDGEVRYKTSLNCDGISLGYSLLRALLFTCASSMDDYQPFLESIVIGESTPQEADNNFRRQERGETSE